MFHESQCDILVLFLPKESSINSYLKYFFHLKIMVFESNEKVKLK